MKYELRPSDRAAAAELAGAVGVSSIIGQVLMHRGLSSVEEARRFLSPKLSGLTPPEAMLGREEAAARLAAAVRGGEPITVFGDYDVDGTTSAAILGGILEQLGGKVAVLVANRFQGGYGLSAEALERIWETRPTLLVTTDCGSSDHPRIEAAVARGVDVIVVDHHLVPQEPLPALAFLNPHRPDCGFPYKGLCSAGLALSLGAAVRAELDAQLDVRPWLDLVALGTVADVAPLDGDNRALVRAGLARLASPMARPGIVALREIAKIRPGTPIGAVDVAFRMTPRLNAAGRLGDQTVTLALLRARSLPEARALGARIEQLNDERKAIEARVTEEAIAQVLELYGEQPQAGVVAAGQGWHRGVIGITAARLCDRFGVPAVAVALEDGMGHGSARSPHGGVSVHAAISRCEGELVRFGGHAAAAGVTLKADRVEAFRAGFGDGTAALMSEASSGPAPAHVDAIVGAEGYPLPLARELALLEPLGEANAEPVFLLPDAQVSDARVVGSGHLKLKLQVVGQELSAFGLGLGERAPARGSRLRALGNLRPDTWQGGEAIELRLADFELLD
ncbi:MAG: single-stranded-DNA-specific exonuclease RecJ [Myxococcales bacterium]|nr:single-stranded-DNA-specific exonuclease RecJ [Myxococcales bacterium]